ncbi:MAG: TIGR00730 family Rossman fold protein [Robiginitomaculum sp.]
MKQKKVGAQKNNSDKSICVFCGASKGVESYYFDLAQDCGAQIAKRNYRLIYGGGSFGLMGAVAQSAYDAGGDVLGIIPKFLTEIEGLMSNIEHKIVANMHERKHEMHKRSDAYIVLPGGIGTLEEAIEVMSWMRLHLHIKPMIFLDTDGYWAPLMDLLHHTIETKFAPKWLDAHLFHVQTPKFALKLIEEQWKNPAPRGKIHIAEDNITKV